MNDQQEAKVYSVIGRLTLQILELQETVSVQQQQITDLSNQLNAVNGHTKKEDGQVTKEMPVDEAIALLREKGIPVSVDGNKLPSMSNE